MRAVETYRQTNHRWNVKKKGGKKTTSSPPKDTDYANWTSVFNFIYGCLADSVEAHEVNIVILWWGFDNFLWK